MGGTQGLVDPARFHPTSAQLERGADAADGLVRQLAQALAGIGQRAADHAATVGTRWAGLAGCYQAPESERVLGLVGPAVAVVDQVQAALVGVRSALGLYADTLWGIALRLAVLEADAEAFRTSDGVLHGVKETSHDAWDVASAALAGTVVGLASLERGSTAPWYQDEAMVAQNTGLWDRLYRCQQDIETAAQVCATMIDAAAAPDRLLGAATAGVDSTEQIAAFDADQGWGRPRDRALPPAQQVWNAVNNNLVAPTAALAFGWDTTSMDSFARTYASDQAAQARAQGQAWAGTTATLGTWLLAGGYGPTPGQHWLDEALGAGWTDQRRQLLADTALSMIAYDPARPEDGWHKYTDSPYEAATTLAVSVGSLVLGTKGLGTLGKASRAEAGARADQVLPEARAASEGTVEASAALRAEARTDLGTVPAHNPTIPKVSDSIRRVDDALDQGQESWLYQEPPPEPTAPHNPTPTSTQQATHDTRTTSTAEPSGPALPPERLADPPTGPDHPTPNQTHTGPGGSAEPTGGIAEDRTGTEVNTSMSLGEDPAVGHFRQGEFDTAIRIQEERGVTLERSGPGMSSDWVDSSGSTYDAVGNFDSGYFDAQWPNLQRQIVRHLDKADYVPVDVSMFTPEQIEIVRDFISDLGPRVFIIGGRP